MFKLLIQENENCKFSDVCNNCGGNLESFISDLLALKSYKLNTSSYGFDKNYAVRKNVDTCVELITLFDIYNLIKSSNDFDEKNRDLSYKRKDSNFEIDTKEFTTVSHKILKNGIDVDESNDKDKKHVSNLKSFNKRIRTDSELIYSNHDTLDQTNEPSSESFSKQTNSSLVWSHQSGQRFKRIDPARVNYAHDSLRDNVKCMPSVAANFKQNQEMMSVRGKQFNKHKQKNKAKLYAAGLETEVKSYKFEYSDDE